MIILGRFRAVLKNTVNMQTFTQYWQHVKNYLTCFCLFLYLKLTFFDSYKNEYIFCQALF